jgi:hypothetical protein
MQTISNKIINRIYGNGRDWCFTPKNFHDLGSPEVVRINLHRLEKKGVIRRLARGLYEYPKKHTSIGLLSPSPQKIAKAIALRYAVRIQPSGAFAANMLGLSEQVPAKIVFLTDGPRRRIKIGSQEILLKKTTPRNLAMNGKFSGALIHALRHIGKKQIKQHHIEHLKNIMESRAKEMLKKDRIYAPEWMYPLIDSIAGGSSARIR